MQTNSQISPTEQDHWQLRYWTIFIGQMLSQTGSSITQFVLMWWITLTTGSASALATAGIFALLPQAILGPLGGTFADRYSRRLIMIVTDLVSALCMAVLIYLFSTEQVALWHIYTLLAIRSSMQAFQGPASQSSVAMLVPPSFLARAAGLSQSAMGFMTIASAPVGALAMSLMPFQGALMIDVFTAVLGIVPLLIYAIPQVEIAKADRLGLWQEFREGVSLVWENAALRRLFSLETLVILVIMPCFSLVPLLITQHFKGTAGTVAIMEGLAGLGMLAGGMSVAVFNPKRKLFTFLIGLSISCLTVALTAFTPSNMFWVAVFFWAVSGFAYSFGNAPLTAILQSTIPNRLQGRAFSLLATMMGLAAPVGLAIFGPLGNLIGTQAVFIYSGVIASGVCLLGFLSPQLLQLETHTTAETLS